MMMAALHAVGDRQGGAEAQQLAIYGIFRQYSLGESFQGGGLIGHMSIYSPVACLLRRNHPSHIGQGLPQVTHTLVDDIANTFG